MALVVLGGAQPLKKHRQSNDHITEGYNLNIQVAAVAGRNKNVGKTKGKDHHSEHLHERETAEQPIIGVIGACKPCVLGPGPSNGCNGADKGDDAGNDMVFADQVSKFVGRNAKGNNKGQVKEEL